MPQSFKVSHKLLYNLVTNMVLLMNKLEALAVLREIYDSCKGSLTTSLVSVDSSQVSHIFTGGYQIKLKVELDSYSREIIKAIMKKQKLYMKEQNGYVILLSITD